MYFSFFLFGWQLVHTFTKPSCLASFIKCLNFRIVKITLCDKANKISEAEFIAKMQEITNRST